MPAPTALAPASPADLRSDLDPDVRLDLDPDPHLDLHPDLDTPVLRDLVFPDRPLWTPAQLRELTRTLIADHRETLHAVARYTEPDRWWTRLALTRGVEVWLLTWLPGQGTDPHDHGGASGSFAVLHGQVREDYRYPGGQIRTRTHAPGHSVGFGGDRAHQVSNAGGAASATVHAYSPPLLPTRRYGGLEEVR